MMTMGKLVFLIMLGYSLGCFAYQAQPGQVNAFFGPFLHQIDYDNSKVFHDERWSGGFGLLVTGDLHEKAAIELSIFHFYKTFFRELDDRLIAEKTGFLHFTMGYRRYFSEKWSGSLSFTSSYTMEKRREIFSSLQATDVRPTSASDITEYGYDLAVQYEFWRRLEEAIVLDTRYHISVTNKVKEYGNHYGFYIAYRRLIK